jgi:diguanylate cyclase (GGDEF)-like protein
VPPIVEAIWEDHFRQPAAAYDRARSMLADPGTPVDAAAWAELTIGYHQLFFSTGPGRARHWLAKAHSHFVERGERRGALLADTGLARLMIVEETPARACGRLLAISSAAQRILAPQDRYWVTSTLGAAHYFSDRIDEAIRCLYDGLELLQRVAPSPQLPAVMSDLAAGLIAVGDYEPARELAQDALGLLSHFDNPQLRLSAGTSLAESLLALGKADGALAAVEATLAAAAAEPGTPVQNHYCAVAAEVCAHHARRAEARRCAAMARLIRNRFPGGFNETDYRWAAAVAAADGPAARAIATLEQAIAAAEAIRHVPTLCKAHERLAERYAALGRFEDAYRHQQRFTAVLARRLATRVDVKYYLLKVQHELQHARAERDRADRQRQETLALNTELERLNAELQRQVREIESLQARLAAEAMQDPLTGLFNRRYLDTAMRGLIAHASRRGEPLALALVDLDHFKRINDRYGHQAGDAALTEIGRLFAHALRSCDVFCRYGGEEFCVVFPDTDGTGAAAALAGLAARLRELVVPWEGHVIEGLTFSAGVAVYPQHARTFAGLVASADRALYTAKGEGRDRIRLATTQSGGGRLRRARPAA